MWFRAPVESNALKEEADPIDVHAGRRICAVRRAAGLTQAELAEHLGVSFQQVQKYERGMNRVSVSALYRIARALGADPSFVFDGLSAPKREPAASSTLDRFALEPGAPQLVENYLRLGRSRQAALVAVARALLDEQPSALTGRSGPHDMLAECRPLPAKVPSRHLRRVR